MAEVEEMEDVEDVVEASTGPSRQKNLKESMSYWW